MQNPYWFFNTDESEIEGEGAYMEMLNRSVIAAWGDCNGNGAEKKIPKQPEGWLHNLLLFGWHWNNRKRESVRACISKQYDIWTGW